MQEYICEACGKSTHSAGITMCCVHCGGFLAREREAAREAGDKDTADRLVARRVP